MSETPMRRYLRFKNADRDPTLDKNTIRAPHAGSAPPSHGPMIPKARRMPSRSVGPKQHYHK
jgi:hypothetical protein